MKEVTVKGITLQYDLRYSYYDEYTEFYYGIETVRRKKFYLFGPVIEYTKPKYVFTIYASTEDPSLSKEWWYNKISKKIDLMNRKEEIAQGILTHKP